MSGAVLRAKPRRVARVVAWLEELAAEQLDREEAAAVKVGGSTMSFSEREGLPLNTRDALEEAPSHTRQGVTELDPDGATR